MGSEHCGLTVPDRYVSPASRTFQKVRTPVNLILYVFFITSFVVCFWLQALVSSAPGEF